MRWFGHRFRLLAGLLVVLSPCVLIARADTLASHLPGPHDAGDTGTGFGNTFYYGQGFTVSGTGSFDDISFSFLNSSDQNYAIGTAYLFTSPYLGTPSGLASSSYLGSAVASGYLYSFSSALQLTGGQTYYLYEDTSPALNAFGVDGTTGTYSYVSSGDFAMFAKRSVGTYDYIVTGDPVSAATPEPSSLALLGTSMLALSGLVRRRVS